MIVTGTGRCGTVFMANALTSMGWPCGHEAVFGTEGIERAREIVQGKSPPDNSPISKSEEILSEGADLVGDSSYMAAPFLREFDATVIHVVRNPIFVVASMIGEFFRNFSQPFPTDFEDQPDHLRYESFIYRHVSELSEDIPQIDRACLFYIRWNEMIESSGKVDLFHRIEDPIDKVKKLFLFKGDCYSNSHCNSLSSSSKRWRLSQIWDAKIRKEMKDIMKRYGYKEPALLL